MLRIHLQDFFFQKRWEKNIGINWAWGGKREWRSKAILLAGRYSPGKISIRCTYRERHPFRKWLSLHMLGHLALPVTTPVWAEDKCAFTDSLHTHTHTHTHSDHRLSNLQLLKEQTQTCMDSVSQTDFLKDTHIRMDKLKYILPSQITENV